MSTVRCVIQECRRSQSWGCHEDRILTRVGMQPGPDGLIQRLRQQSQSILQCPYPPTYPPGPRGRQGQSSFSQVDRTHLDESLPGPRATSRMLLTVGLVPTPHSPSPSSQILSVLIILFIACSLLSFCQTALPTLYLLLKSRTTTKFSITIITTAFFNFYFLLKYR